MRISAWLGCCFSRVMRRRASRAARHGWTGAQAVDTSSDAARRAQHGIQATRALCLGAHLTRCRGSQLCRRAPFYFSTSLDTAHKEEGRWSTYWRGPRRKSRRGRIFCQKKQEPNERLMERVEEAASHPRCRVLGVVVEIVDQMVDGALTARKNFTLRFAHWTETDASSGSSKRVFARLRSDRHC